MTEWDVMPSQTSNLLPLFLDMVPEECREMVVGRLLESVVKQQGLHLDTGIVGLRYLFDVLTGLGYQEIAYRIITQTSYPGWGYMLREGATTLWERWEKIEGEGMNSNNHVMLGSVGRFVLPRLGKPISIRESGRPFDVAELKEKTQPERSGDAQTRESAMVLDKLVCGRYFFQIDYADVSRRSIVTA